jgi:hypothetical protein
MNSEKTSEPGKSYGFWLLITALFGALVLPIGGFFIAALLNTDLKFFELVGKLGPLGDYFAGIANPLISLFLFRLTYQIYTNQRQEMRDSVQALQDQGSTSKEQLHQQRVETNIRRWEALRDWYLKSRTELGISGVSKKELVQLATKREFDLWGDHDNLFNSYNRLLSGSADVKHSLQMLVSCITIGQKMEDSASVLNNLLIGQLTSEERFAFALVAVFGIDGNGSNEVFLAVEQFGFAACIDIDTAVQPGAAYEKTQLRSRFSGAAAELRHALNHMKERRVSFRD